MADENKKVFEYKKLGSLKFKLKEVMDARGITRNKLAHDIDVRNEVINRWYNGTLDRIDVEVACKLCYSLGCKLEDLVEYCEVDNAED